MRGQVYPTAHYDAITAMVSASQGLTELQALVRSSQRLSVSVLHPVWSYGSAAAPALPWGSPRLQMLAPHSI